jgi:hypothetical protein
MLVILTFFLCTLDDPQWIEFSPKDGSFTARFPQQPTERASRTGTVWQYSAKDRVYNVARSAAASGNNPSPAEVTAALDAVRDNIVKRVEAKVLKEKTMQHRNSAAREFVFELPEGKGLLRLRCFVLKGNVWEIKVGGPKDYVTGAEADAFLDGLKVK